MGRGQRAREGVAEPAAGGGRARAVAAMGSLEAAQQALVASPYSRGVRVGRHWPRPSTRWSSLVCPYTSPVIEMELCPSRSATALICTPDSSQPKAAECRRVCAPTPSTPAALAATSMTRRKLRGSTGPPNSVVNTSPRVGPLVARAEPFRLLFGAVLAQHRHDRGRYGYCASRTVGLRLTDDQLVVDPRNGRRDLDGSGVEVDAIPPQRQRLTLAQPGRCDEHQHRVVAGRLSGPQHRGHVGIVQVSGLAPFDARTLHQGSRAP